MLEQALLLFRKDDHAIEARQRLRVKPIDGRADPLPERKARIVGHVKGRHHRQAQLVTEFGEPEVDQCREAERDVHQVDLLTAKQIGDDAFCPRRGDDVSVTARQRPQGERIVADGGQSAVMDEEDLDTTRPKPGDDLPGIRQQPVTGAAALMAQPGNPQRLVHPESMSLRSSIKNGRF